MNVRAYTDYEQCNHAAKTFIQNMPPYIVISLEIYINHMVIHMQFASLQKSNIKS